MVASATVVSEALTVIAVCVAATTTLGVAATRATATFDGVGAEATGGAGGATRMIDGAPEVRVMHGASQEVRTPHSLAQEVKTGTVVEPEAETGSASQPSTTANGVYV